MDLGIAQGAFSNDGEGYANGIYRGVNTGLSNGLYETINKGISKNGLVLWLDASRSDSYFAPYNNSQTAYDLSFNGNNCTSVNSVLYETGFNGVWRFGGNYYETVNNENLNLRTTGTYSAWIYPFNTTQSQFCGMITRASNGGAGFVSSLCWRPLNSPPVIIGALYNGSTFNLVTIPAPTVANIWYHYVFTWSGSSLRFYRNGLLVSSLVQTIIGSNVSVPVRIGGHGVGGSSGGAESFTGYIGEALIYNRAITKEEVMQNYLSTKSRFGL